MKKKNKILYIILICVLFLTTGCGNNNYIKDKKKIVIDPSTGQNLQTEIYCKPSKNTEIYKLYQKYEKQMKVKLSKLPECENFKVNSNKTTSLWQLLFVKPLAYLIIKLGNVLQKLGFKNAYLGISLMLIGLAIRLIILPFTIKAQKQSQKIQELTPELKKIEKKYANKTDQESLMMKSQETMALYQKYKVKPLGSCLLTLIQLPLFFAFLQAIYKIPTIYEGSIFGWNLGTTPSVGITTYHQYSYIILIILILLTTFFSFKYTMSQSSATSATPDAGNQMKTMLIIMTVFIGLASLGLPTAIALYWIVTYAFIIIQTFIMNKIKNNKNKKNNRKIEKSTKKIKDKLILKEGLKYGKNK